MERPHHPSDREHHGTANDSRDRRRRESATTSRTKGHHQANKEDRLMPKPSRKLPQETWVGQLSGDNDYVRRWLVQTDEEANQKISDSRVARQKSPNHVEPKTDVEIGLCYRVLEESPVPSQRKRKHHTSSDSSLLEALVRPKPQPRRVSGLKTEPPARDEESDRPRKKRKTGVSSSGPSTASTASWSPKKETFEKRVRHKTREERYEPKKKEKQRPKDGVEKRPRKKKEKKGDLKKAAKKAGEDLMQNFSSTSISQERLTIRPYQGFGLFKNGRASSPVHRRGIPDLAFSEMDFLQRSGRHVSTMKEDKISSKSREKEKRKAARAQDEISTFFKPNKLPLQPISLNGDSLASSTYTKHHCSGNSDRLDAGYSRRGDQRSPSFDFPEEPSLDFRRIRPTLDIILASNRCSPLINRTENILESTSKLSGRSSTHISWSETLVSREEKSRELSKVDRTRASSTPESIRISLEKTGIFRGTGIGIAARRAAVSSQAYERPSIHQTRTTGHLIRSTETPESSRRVASPTRLTSHELSSSHTDQRRDLAEKAEISSANIDITQGKGEEMKRERIVIEHFDPNLGWHEKPTSAGYEQEPPPRVKNREVPEQLKSAPLDRLERAHMARIKRPSTTVPLSRPSPAREEAIIRHSFEGHEQTNELVEQELNRGIPSRDKAEVIHPTKPVCLEMESGNQPTNQPQRNESVQFGLLPLCNSNVSDRTAHGIAQTGKELQHATPLPQKKHIKPDHEAYFTLHQATEHNNNSSYLGLPARGFAAGRAPLQDGFQNYNARPSHADSEPNYIHQLQRQTTSYEPPHYEDQLRSIEYGELDILTRVGTTTEVDGFQRSNIPGGIGFSNFYSPVDQYIDHVSQQAHEEFEGNGKGHLEAEMLNFESPYVDMDLEHYEIEELGYERYEEGQMVEDFQRQESYMQDYSPAEQERGYEQYGGGLDGQDEAFWQPHPQY